MSEEGVDQSRAASLQQAGYWAGVYTAIMAMEHSLARSLMSAQSAQLHKEVEQIDLPVILAQTERFRQRLSYWNMRTEALLNAGDADDEDRTLIDAAAHASR